jgi:PAS domain S-box-containing protein
MNDATRSTAALQESEARFRLLSDSAPALIWVEGENGTRFVNRAYQEFIGASAQTTPADWVTAVHPDDQAALRRTARTAGTMHAPWQAQVRVRRADGEYRWMMAHTVPRRTDDDRPAGYVGSLTDITALKEAEQRLVQADQTKDAFLAMLAHELRNPLAAVRNVAQVLRTAPQDPGIAERGWAILDRQMQHFTHMLDDLLDASRVTSGKITIRPERVDLLEVLNASVQLAGSRSQRPEQQVEIALPSHPVIVVADPLRLEQVFVNLLHNASKFTPDTGTIRLTAEVLRDECDLGSTAGIVEVHIIDNGEGMSPEILPQIFDLFAQGDQAIDRHHGGLGIGLTVVKSLVLLHGGDVSVSSDGPDTGSEFVVRLPLANDP